MNYSQFLRIPEKKNGDRFQWMSTLEDLKKFLSSLGYTAGTWNRVGDLHRYTTSTTPTSSDKLVFTWFAGSKKKTLQIQGKKSNEIKDMLRQIVAGPTPLAAAGNESKTERKALEAEGREIDFHDGLYAGKDIANFLQFKMKKWKREGAEVTIATPFLDMFGLDIIMSCLNKTTLDRVYTRKNCYWDTNIDDIIVDNELSKHWIVSKVVALKKSCSFHAKFLAGKYEAKVDLVGTSCNMTNAVFTLTRLPR